MDKSGWTYKRLDEVCDKGSSNIVINKLESNEGDYPLFGASGIVKTIDFYHQDKPYIGIVKDGSGVGRVNTYPAYSSLVGTMQYILPKDGEQLKYIKYFLEKLDLSHLVTGAAIPHIYFKDYGKKMIPLPSKEIQRQIVEELDAINESINLLQQQVKDLDSLAQSIFYDMFGDPIDNSKGWEVKTLKDVSVEKLSYGSGASAVKFDGNVRYIRITDVDDLGYLNDDVVSPSVFEEKYLLKEGDILFARSGATVGKTYCHKSKYGTCIFAGYLIRLIPNQKMVLPSYVFGFTKTQYYLAFVRNAQRAVAQPNINAKQYGDLKICVPPLSLQNSYDLRIASIEETKNSLYEQISELQSLLASRMQYWFE